MAHSRRRHRQSARAHWEHARSLQVSKTNINRQLHKRGNVPPSPHSTIQLLLHAIVSRVYKPPEILNPVSVTKPPVSRSNHSYILPINRRCHCTSLPTTPFRRHHHHVAKVPSWEPQTSSRFRLVQRSLNPTRQDEHRLHRAISRPPHRERRVTPYPPRHLVEAPPIKRLQRQWLGARVANGRSAAMRTFQACTESPSA